MGAPQKTTGGSKSKATKAPSAHLSARGSARSKPASLPPSNLKGAVSDRRRAEAIRERTPSEASGPAGPPRHSGRSARPQILQVAEQKAAERGYVHLRLRDITSEVGITHQGFYGHFANKRHAVALATSESLGAIVDLAMRGLRRQEPWAERLVAEIDNALAEIYPAPDGPERRILRLLVEEIPSRGYEAIRIAELVRAGGVGQQEFYRRYGGRIGCLRRIYAELLDQLRAELAEADGADVPIERLGVLLAQDPERAKLLVLGASHLPEGPDQPQAASQASLPAFVAEILGGEDDPRARALAWGAVEVIRAAVLSDRIDRLAEDLAGLGRSWRGRGEAAVRLAA